MSEPLVSDEQLAEIERRWSPNGGMDNPRSADDYTDAGCRMLAEHAFRDVSLLLRALRDARAERAREPIRTAIEYDHWRDAAITNRNEADSLRAAIEHALEDMGTSTLGAHILRAALAAPTGQEPGRE